MGIRLPSAPLKAVSSFRPFLARGEVRDPLRHPWSAMAEQLAHSVQVRSSHHEP